MTAIGTSQQVWQKGPHGAHLGGFPRPGHLSGFHDVGEVPVREDPTAEREVQLPTVPRAGLEASPVPRPSSYSLQPLAGGDGGEGVRAPPEPPLVVAVVSSPLEEQRNMSGHAPTLRKARRMAGHTEAAPCAGDCSPSTPGPVEPGSTLCS